MDYIMVMQASNQAYDLIGIYAITDKYDIPDKLIWLITLTLQITRAKVKIINELTAGVAINSGVKQGDPLPALLFSLVIYQVIYQPD
jgi:hypothetical protein